MAIIEVVANIRCYQMMILLNQPVMELVTVCVNIIVYCFSPSDVSQ